MTGLRNLLRALFRHDALNRDMNDEMRDHLTRSTERLMGRGMSRRDAEAQARREFGNVSVLSEAGRDARGASWVETLRGDVRYGLRTLRSSPAFTAVAVLSLAVAIGANTAIFSLINAVILKPLPVERPDELLRVSIRDSLAKPDAIGALYFTNPLWEQLRDQSTEVGHYAVFANTGFSLVAGGEARSARGSYVNGAFFNTLGVRPLLGRLILPADDYRGCPATVVLGEAFWQSEFGGTRDVVGRTVRLENKPFTVIGVVPREFFGVEVGTVQQLYAPLCSEAVIRGAASTLDRKSNWWLRAIVRPARNVSKVQLGERLARLTRPAMAAALPTEWPAETIAEYTSSKFNLTPAFHGVSEVRDRYATSLKILMGMVGLILLIACANVANLSLARGEVRAREMAVRIAIGASRGRVMRQLLTEAVLVAGAGTLLGAAMAVWATRLLVGLLGTGQRQVMLDLSPDWTVLGFSIATCAATVLLFAVLPAWRSTRVDPQIAMKAGGRGTAEGHNRFRIGKGLVVAQSALAFVLVVGAGLLVATFARLTKSDMGFDLNGVLAARVRLTGTAIPETERNATMERMRRQIEMTAGVQSVSRVEITPVQGSSWNEEVVADGAAAATPSVIPWFNAVAPGYFRTMRTELLAGRDFGVQDTPNSSRVAVVNEAAGRLLFKDPSPLGRSYRIKRREGLSEPTTIVGVVENSRYRSVRESDEPIIYVPMQQEAPSATGQFVVRAGAAIPAVIGTIKATAKAIDPDILLQFTVLEDQVAASIQREKALAVLSGFFGVLALALAMIGLYGVLTYTVARRRVEIGIRVALGAVRTQVIGMVLGDVATLVGAGLVIGGAATWATTKVLGSLLYGVDARDLPTMIGAAFILAAAALMAGAIPAWRAAALRPVEALRED